MSFLDKIMPPGSMLVQPEKTSYSSGETIKGKIILTTKKPINATELVVKLSAIEKYRDSQGKEKSNNVYNFEITLEKGPKLFTTSEYNFEIKIPQVSGNAPNLSSAGTAGIIVGALIASSQKFSVREWFLEGDLKIPGGRNIARKLRLNIG